MKTKNARRSLRNVSSAQRLPENPSTMLEATGTCWGQVLRSVTSARNPVAADAGSAGVGPNGSDQNENPFEVVMAPRSGAGLRTAMAPGGVEPPRTDSKSVALSAELRGRAAQRSGGSCQIETA